MSRNMLRPTVISLVALLTLNGAYLVGFAAPTVAYVANVLLHVGLGLVATVFWLRWTIRLFRDRRFSVAWLVASIAALTGISLILFGNPSSRWLLRAVHIASAFGIAVFLLFFLHRVAPVRRVRSRSVDERAGSSVRRAWPGIVTVALSAVVIAVHVTPDRADSVGNYELSAATLEDDAMRGADGPFFPSSAETATGDTITASFFLGSEACQRCHEDVFDQWNSSAHHFSSFNNQWYRKSIEYMQDVVGNRPPQWCAGCHDPALLFSGRMNQPVENFINTEAAHAGLACTSCHSITSVKSTRGNGGYVIEYPKMHDLVESDNPVLQKLHDFVLRVDPGPHKSAFLRPFQRQQPAEFCQTCHKVHLDVPVNNYRWIRGFNTYDNWQASGVSGQGARSFYAPPNPLNCVDCHMPQVASRDAGHVDGFVSTHRFAAANTALPTANNDSVQMAEVVRFMTSGALGIDVFGLVANRDEPGVPPRPIEETDENGGAGQIASSFAAGEEEMGFDTPRYHRDTLALAAPLNLVPASVSPGETYRLDVVTRSRIVGHFFPSGTVDAQEAWVEVEGYDEAGRRFFWSGYVDDDRRVDPSAHFFKSLMVDGAGNPINKRNAWAMRSVVYVNLIPPGATDIAHYRIQIPDEARGSVTFVARLNYRKFTDEYTKFAYAGEPSAGDTSASLVTPHYDNRRFVLTADVSEVSGPMKQIPDPPIVVMASDTVVVTVGQASGALSDAKPALWERWTDYGIGLLAEGDLRGAERAFNRAAAAGSDKPDSWVNLARVFIADDELDKADEVLARAFELKPDFHKARFFRALVLKSRGEYDAAIRMLDAVREDYPADRVVLNQRARILFLEGRHAEAADGFKKVLVIDSEDLMAHYNLMLVYRALGESALADQHEARYRRYKDDETSQAIARGYRARHPHDNNESQAIHEHASMWRASGTTPREVVGG